MQWRCLGSRWCDTFQHRRTVETIVLLTSNQWIPNGTGKRSQFNGVSPFCFGYPEAFTLLSNSSWIAESVDIAMILLPLVFLWSRAPMSYGLPSKAAILIAFVFSALMLSVPTQLCGWQSAAAADSWDSDLASEVDDPRGETSRPRMREGARLGASTGKLSRSGRRWLFEQEPATMDEASADMHGKKTMAAESKHAAAVEPMAVTRYRVLENLALQRIADAITQDPNDVRWTVTGVITEFGGENWLLLTTVFRAAGAADDL